MPAISFNRPFIPIDKETGEKYPTARTFAIDGEGYGFAQIHQPSEEEIRELGFHMMIPQIRITFEDPVLETTAEWTYLNSQKTARQVIADEVMLEHIIREQLGFID